MRRFLIYWRFHIIFAIMLVATLSQAFMAARADSTLWLVIHLAGLAFGVRACIGFYKLVKVLNEIHRRANVEIPEGEITFE